MESRMKRYETSVPKQKLSRSSRNQELYDRLNDVSAFSSLTDVKETNTVVLDATEKSYRTREGYQKLKEYGDFVPKPKVRKELDDFNHLYKDRENVVYDINSVIEEAKKNRQKRDELEEKRRLKNTSYNILASLNEEELEEFKKNHNKIIRANDEEEIKEIINTITMKAINGEIDQQTSVNLLSDLMATQALDRVEGIPSEEEQKEEKEQEKSKEILTASDLKLVEEKNIEESIREQERKEKNQSKNIFKDMDQSFYTRSMDLSDKDFDTGDDDDEEEKKSHPLLKILFTLIFLALIGVVVYFIIKKGI